MRRLAPIFAALLLAACDSPATPAPAPTEFVFALPPAAISRPDGAVPPLPPNGHVGVGALLYTTGDSLAPHLVLSSGQHLRLSSPPSGEGRNGTMLATLSPDGRRLGHRKAQYAGDKRYLIRDLNGQRPTIEIQGLPMMWSTEGRFLLTRAHDSGLYQLIEPATGKVAQTSPTGGPVAILAGGSMLSTQSVAYPGPVELKLSGPGLDVTITFAADRDHECWCPDSHQVSPDGTTIAMLLVYRNGNIPGTKEKSKPRSGAQVAVYELATGLHKFTVAGGVLHDGI